MNIKATWTIIDDRLQGRLSLPVDDATFRQEGWCAVVTHPHPKLGGDLNNNVTVAIARELESLGVATLRFNTRGVGKSSGSSTWRGVEERQDIKAAVMFARTQPGVQKVALVAYSFGAAVGLSVSAELAEAKMLDAMICVGYPKGFLSWFIFSPHYSLVDPGPSIPKLFVIGDRDDFTTVSTMQKIVDRVSEPKELIIVEDTDHFCFGNEHLLSEPVARFFRKLMQEKSSSQVASM